MKKGHVISISGALIVILSVLLLPWAEGDQIGFIRGYELIGGQAALGFAVLTLVFSGIGFVTGNLKRFAIADLITSGLVVAGVLYGGYSLSTVANLDILNGIYLAFLGAVLIAIGSIWELAAEPIIRPDDRLLRVAILWNNKILKETTFKIKKPIYIGEGLRNDFIIPHTALPARYPLFVVDKKGNYSIGLRKEFNGHVNVNGVYENIPQYVKKHTSDISGVNYVSIKPGDWGLIDFKDTSLFFQFVKPAIVIMRRPFMALDGQFFATMTVSAVGVIIFLLMSIFFWEESIAMRGKKEDKRFLKVDVEITPEKDEDLLQIGEEEDTVGKKAEGEEGKFGDPEEDPLKESKVPKRDGKMVSKIDPKQVGLSDILNINKLGRHSAISSILSDDADMFSNKIAVAMAGTGSELVIGHGAGGMGFKGTGPGGGGTGGYGRIHGLGKVDTGGGLGVRTSLGKKAQAKVGTVSLGSGTSTGFCQRGNIQKVVMQRAGAIRACYEAQLQIYPELAGKVTTRWTINLEGTVDGESILSSTLGNTAVEQCILRTIRKMKFDRPEGGICVVQWPFVFNPG